MHGIHRNIKQEIRGGRIRPHKTYITSIHHIPPHALNINVPYTEIIITKTVTVPSLKSVRWTSNTLG